jgi:hypothetical protein
MFCSLHRPRHRVYSKSAIEDSGLSLASIENGAGIVLLMHDFQERCQMIAQFRKCRLTTAYVANMEREHEMARTRILL